MDNSWGIYLLLIGDLFVLKPTVSTFFRVMLGIEYYVRIDAF